MNKILCVITARSGSKKLKNKNILPLKKIPLMAHTILAAKKSKFLDRVILSTDSKKYASIGKKFGAEVPFLRPKSLATSKSHHPDVVKHALNYIEKKNKKNFDIIVMLQPTSPFREACHIDLALKKFLKEKNNSLISLKKQDYPPWWFFKLKKNKNLNFLNFKNKNVFNLERQQFPKLYRPNGAIYICRKSTLMSGDLVDPKSCGFLLMDEKSSIDIDSEIDLKIAENI